MLGTKDLTNQPLGPIPTYGRPEAATDLNPKPNAVQTVGRDVEDEVAIRGTASGGEDPIEIALEPQPFRFFESQSAFHKADYTPECASSKKTTKTKAFLNNSDARCTTRCTDPSLLTVCKAWDHLPQALKAGILAMVQTAISTPRQQCLHKHKSRISKESANCVDGQTGNAPKAGNRRANQ